jgi:3,4-dihydroxy-2-butanone 4-phosphate synthase
MKKEDFIKMLKIIAEQHICLVKSNSELLQLNLNLMKEADKYRKGFNLLLDYFDSISDEEQPKVSKQLERVGL